MSEARPRLSLSLTIGAATAFFLSLIPMLSGMCIHLCIAAYVMVRHYCGSNGVEVSRSQAFRIAFLATGLGVLLSQLFSGVNYYIENGTDISEFKAEALANMSQMDDGTGNVKEAMELLSAKEADGLWFMLIIATFVFGGLVSALVGAAIGGLIAAAHVKRLGEME